MPPPDLPDFPASQLFLRRLAFHLVHDEARAEDLVQDTWAAWVEHKPRGVTEPKAWLARVLRNRAFNLKRADERRAQRESFAGRPDPSTPETDGTLEAQAKLIEALRELEEPYRSTLVQRYYHDLAPKEIAERAGTPLNTVKARLARGLEKLRTGMDRRYRGDRSAWCHWLMSLGNPPLVPATAPSSTGTPSSEGSPYGRSIFPSARSAATAGTSGAPPALLSWMLLAGGLVSGVSWVIWRSGRSTLPSMPLVFEMDSPRAPVELVEPRYETRFAQPVQAAPKSEVPPPQAVVEPPPTAIAPPLPFEWPQLGGTPTHDTFSAFRERIDLVQHPRVFWGQRNLLGSPTVSGTDLYSGGSSLFHLDLVSNKLTWVKEQDLREHLPPVLPSPGDREDWLRRLARSGLTESSWIAAAPAITADSVLARMVWDGSVSAFDRDLTRELWHWQAENPAPCALSGCLVGDHFLVAQGHQVLSLSIVNGSEDWSFDTGEDGAVNMVPACDGDLVYFATERGVVFALDLARGKQEWRTQSQGVFESPPLVLGDRVVFVAEPAARWNPAASMRAFQTYDGRELWNASVNARWTPGVGEDALYSTSWSGVSRLSINSGTIVEKTFLQQMGYDALLSASPLQVGASLYLSPKEPERVSLLACDVRSLGVAPARFLDVRWTFELPSQCALIELVHTGDRIYVATSVGLICIGDDPAKGPVPPGHVLRLGSEGDTGAPGASPVPEYRRRKR